MAQDLYFTERSASDQYGAMQLSAPVAPTMTTVGLKFDMPLKTKHGYARTMVQHTPVVVDISGATKARKKRMGTADVVGDPSAPGQDKFVGVVRDQVSLQTVAHQRDPVVAVAVRGILPVAPSSFNDVVGPSVPKTFFKRAHFNYNQVNFDALAEASFGTYLPFGNPAEPYKHAYVIHLNQLSNHIARTNYEIRSGNPAEVEEIAKGAEVVAAAVAAEGAFKEAVKKVEIAKDLDLEKAEAARKAAADAEAKLKKLKKQQQKVKEARAAKAANKKAVKAKKVKIGELPGDAGDEAKEAEDKPELGVLVDFAEA